MAIRKVLIDASVFIAAAGSPTGGSAAVLELGRQGQVLLLASKIVLVEAERNIRQKLSSKKLLRLYEYIGTLPLQVVAAATEEEIAKAAEVVAEKDAHVLAVALRGRADVLLTLDRMHLLAPAVRAASPVVIQTPGEFLQELVA
jgi:putative PIN family toxin of toxin-antitoxin system